MGRGEKGKQRKDVKGWGNWKGGRDGKGWGGGERELNRGEGRERGGRARLEYLSRGSEFLVTPLLLRTG